MKTEPHRRVLRQLRRLAADETAATAIEYAMIAVGVAGVIFAVVFSVRDTLIENYFERILRAFTEAQPPAA